jgi:hypothetical protein
MDKTLKKSPKKIEEDRFCDVLGATKCDAYSPCLVPFVITRQIGGNGSANIYDVAHT